MAVTRISDVIVPTKFTDYIVANTMQTNSFVLSNIVQRNAEIEDQLKAGAQSFSVPFWGDLADDEADVIGDDPAVNSTPAKLTTGKQIVRKSFLHKSWSAMNLASELAGDDALTRIQTRAAEYWTRQVERRLISTLNGILADNVANDAGDMIYDISGLAGAAAVFTPAAVITAAGTLGDRMRDVAGFAVHSATYKKMLSDDMITTIPNSSGGWIQTFRGLALVIDDQLPVSGAVYTSVLFAPGAVGWGISEPRVAEGTEVENLPSSGNGGGQQVLHSRVNLAVHPAGFQWKEASVAGNSPTITELATATNWDRVVERKAVPIAFLKCKLA